MTRPETPAQRDFLNHAQCPQCGSDDVCWDRLEESDAVAYQRFSCGFCGEEGAVDFERVGHRRFRYGTTPTGKPRQDTIYRA